MYPNRCKQSGFLLPVALVLIVGIAALAVAISKLTAQANVGAFREGLSMQAFYAAESGMQYGMNRVIFPDASRASGVTQCAAVDTQSLTFGVDGLDGCSTTINCSSSANAADNTTFFTLTSSATCGSGQLLTERIIQASAYMSD